MTRITLVPWDPEWPPRFDAHARVIREALGTSALQLDHVGSTAVPGLAAKPVIDVLLVGEDSSNEASWLPALEAVGFTCVLREPDWYEHRLLQPADASSNVHVLSAGCPEIARMLHFRDWLRQHADDRRLYESTKRALAQRDWASVDDYAQAKSAVVDSILARATR
jgi:GrpB-like predicted nucleotidyltransferase (UPF0157 family)